MKAANAMTPADVRQVLLASESLLRAGDPYAATARAKDAAAAVVTSSPAGTELGREVLLGVARFEAAQDAALAEVRERQAIHLANERRATRIATGPRTPRSSPDHPRAREGSRTASVARSNAGGSVSPSTGPRGDVSGGRSDRERTPRLTGDPSQLSEHVHRRDDSHEPVVRIEDDEAMDHPRTP